MFANCLFRQADILFKSHNLDVQYLKKKIKCSTFGSVLKDKKSISEKKNEFIKYGQPTYYTHPHLLKKDEILPHLKRNEFINRRHQLILAVQEFSSNIYSEEQNHIIIVPSSTKKYMSDKIPYVFRQNTDFLYLTGCLEPDCVLILTSGQFSNESHLFLRPKNINTELWEGPRTRIENAIEYFGVDHAYETKSIDTFLKGLIHKNKSLKVWYDTKISDQHYLTDLVKSCVSSIIETPTLLIHELRLIKSEAEMELMRQTCKIASESINETIRETQPGDTEHQVFARVDYKCRMKNANYLAYPPVVAAGINATTIHYINNTQLIKQNDMILMDAGCEYGGYTSDITRTWPANGKFNAAQKLLYEVVLQLQKDLFNVLLKDGGRTLDELFHTMCLRLGVYLQDIGLISKDVKGDNLKKEAFKFCPHHVSHYLGMDVHDTSLISRSINLQPGMVFTIEPGIYINSERTEVPKEFRGIGIRIEDDVLIKTNETIENLTAVCIKEIESLEK